MVLLCNVCQPTDNWKYGEKGVLALAKWYPNGAYYSNCSEMELGHKLLEFLEEHSHCELASEHYTKGAGQENPVRLVYESKGLPILQNLTEGEWVRVKKTGNYTIGVENLPDPDILTIKESDEYKTKVIKEFGAKVERISQKIRENLKDLRINQ